VQLGNKWYPYPYFTNLLVQPSGMKSGLHPADDEWVFVCEEMLGRKWRLECMECKLEFKVTHDFAVKA